jgi:hypothetical protein
MCFGTDVTMTSAQFQASTLLPKVLGITSATLSTLETTMATDAGDANDTTTVINTKFRVITGDTAARIDKTRAVAFHCPTLAVPRVYSNTHLATVRPSLR